MTDKKTEELNEKDLDNVQGGLGNFEIQDLVKNPGKGDGLKKPDPKQMERVFDDE